MIVELKTTGIAIRLNAKDVNHVWIGVTQTCLIVDGTRRQIRPNTKPHDQMKLEECQILLQELIKFERSVTA